MFIYCICTQYLVGAPFALITASIRRGMEVISLWHCWGGMEARFLWQWPSAHLHCWVWCLSSSSCSGLVSLLANQAHQHHGHWTSFWYLWQCGQVPSPAGKWNQHLHKAGQQKEAWSAIKFPGRWLHWLDFRKHSGPTPADDMAAQIITDCGNFTLDFKQHGFCASPLFLQTLGPWFPNEMQNLLSSEKRTLDHWVLFLHSPGKMLLTLSLVQKWLGSPFPEDVWAWWLLMHWLQLQSTPCEALTSVWISFALKLAVIPVACAPFPTQILPSSQLCI